MHFLMDYAMTTKEVFFFTLFPGIFTCLIIFFRRLLRNHWKHEAEQMERDAGLSVTSLTSDATGAGMWRKQKVSTCDLESSMLMRADGVDDEIVSIRRQADLVAVKRTNAEDTLAVLCKHLDSLGAPHF